jgi:predicted DNA-binding protein
MSKRTDSTIKAQDKYSDKNPTIRIDIETRDKLDKYSKKNNNRPIKDIIKESVDQYIDIDYKDVIKRINAYSLIAKVSIKDILKESVNQYIDEKIGR